MIFLGGGGGWWGEARKPFFFGIFFLDRGHRHCREERKTLQHCLEKGRPWASPTKELEALMTLSYIFFVRINWYINLYNLSPISPLKFKFLKETIGLPHIELEVLSGLKV